ncbi:hypothetical protein M8998_10115 [Sphingobacterium sp. lm-10]|uniref:hypothetical protein n=1 Tax=Sphingobacterium sp. lm-10 TaxID=2944904 RepID=UPI0020220F8F|nr:hypothetical protein [Sphingobacterium sp. lm-10]MCL7988292.1 hypothetical protein [Sphingobacterium sp. lm-10]
MQVLSALLYFLAQHAVIAILVINLIGFLLVIWRFKIRVMVITFILSMLNFFAGNILNAWFLAKFGTNGTAIITSAEQTSSMMNEHYIWEYDVVIKTASGKAVESQFTTSNVSIYPIRNNIEIPSPNQTFVVRYIPGYEKNMVIMSDESEYGKRRINHDNLKVVEKEKTKYEFSPETEEFRKSYIAAMQQYINNTENSMDSVNINKFKAIIRNFRP